MEVKNLLLFAFVSCFQYLASGTGIEPGEKVNLEGKNPVDPLKAKSIFEFFALDIDGGVVDFKKKYNRTVTFIVNVAEK